MIYNYRSYPHNYQINSFATRAKCLNPGQKRAALRTAKALLFGSFFDKGNLVWQLIGIWLPSD